MNRKWVFRLTRLEDPHVQRPKHNTARAPVVVRAGHPNHVWSRDFQFNEIGNGRQ